jgi:hypothetical protein
MAYINMQRSKLKERITLTATSMHSLLLKITYASKKQEVTGHTSHGHAQAHTYIKNVIPLEGS